MAMGWIRPAHCFLGGFRGSGLGGFLLNTAARAVDAVFESIAEGLQEDGVVAIGKWGTYTAEGVG